MTTIRVLLVGTGTHVAHSRLPPVPAVPETIAALRDTFINHCAVRPDDVKTLTDPPGPEAFLDAVIDAADNATDVLIVYYAGHGVLSAGGELHLATQATADLAKKAAYQALPFAELRDVLAGSRAAQVVLILDCCYSGRADNPVPSGALIASADRDEQALAVAGEPYTAFSGSLISALRDGIPAAPPDLRLHHVFDHVYRDMSRRGRPPPIMRIGNRAHELVIARNAAHSDVPQRTQPPADGSCPYRGLEPYSADDESLFAGRSAVVEAVLRRVRESLTTGGLVLVSGPSGCGKTSVAAAGVIPAIRAGELGALMPGAADPVMFTPLRGLTRLEPDRVQIVDQFEELFTADVPESIRREFVQALASASQPVIICVRSDFDDHCARYPDLAAALEERNVVVGPMTTSELRSAIAEPAARNGFALESGLVEILLRDVGADPDDPDAAGYNPGVLPMLSHALLRTWQRREGPTLTVRGYQAVGGVAGAVAASAEEVFATLTPRQQEAARTALLRMVHISAAGPDTRRRIPQSDAGSLDAFARARLITFDRGTVELTHESLIRSWPRLSGWISEDRSGQQARQELADAATAWHQSGRQTALLFRGGRLAAAQSRIRTADLTAEAHEFLAASERHERRQTRIRWGFVAALLVLVLVTSTTAWLAVSRGDRLDRQLTSANAENVANVSNAQVLDQPVFSTRLALAAWRSDQANPAARSALARRYLAMRSVEHVFPDVTSEPITDMAVSEDGRTAVLAHDRGVTVVTGLLGDTPSTWAVPGVGTPIAQLSTDGRWLASFDAGDSVSLWDLRDRSGPLRLPGVPGLSGTVFMDFSADNSKFILVGPETIGSPILAWRTATRERIALPQDLPHSSGDARPQPIKRAWFTDVPDRLLVEYGLPELSEGTFETRSLKDGRLLTRFPAKSQAAVHGRLVVTCPADYKALTTNVVSAATGRRTHSIAVADACPGDYTGDSEHLFKAGRTDVPFATTKVVPVTGGVAYEFVLPSIRREPDLDEPRDWRISVVGASGKSPVIVMAAGRDVLRLKPTTASWTNLGSSSAYADGKYFVVRSDTGLEAVDVASGKRLGFVKEGSFAEVNDFTQLDLHGPLLAIRSGSGWRLIRFEGPDLIPRPLTLPGQRKSTGLVGYLDDSRSILLVGGFLTVWDFPAGHHIAGPFDLGVNFTDDVELAADPLRHNIVAISAPGQQIQLWDVDGGRVLTRIPVSGIPALDRTGERLAVLTKDHSVEIWNVRTAEREGLPMPVPDFKNLLGFTDEGYLAVETDKSELDVQLWDMSRRVMSGELDLPSHLGPADYDSDHDVIRANGTNEVMPSAVPLTATAWFDRLCAAFSGGFSTAEDSLLPAGFDTADPCRK